VNIKFLNDIANRFPRGQIVLTIPLKTLYNAANWVYQRIKILFKGDVK